MYTYKIPKVGRNNYFSKLHTTLPLAYQQHTIPLAGRGCVVLKETHQASVKIDKSKIFAAARVATSRKQRQRQFGATRKGVLQSRVQIIKIAKQGAASEGSLGAGPFLREFFVEGRPAEGSDAGMPARLLLSRRALPSGSQPQQQQQRRESSRAFLQCRGLLQGSEHKGTCL